MAAAGVEYPRRSVVSKKARTPTTFAGNPWSNSNADHHVGVGTWNSLRAQTWIWVLLT